MLKALMLFALLFSLNAHAGLISGLCSRFLVADSPYEYEQANEDYLLRRIEALEIASRWRSLSPRDQAELSLLRSEISQRQLLDTLVSAHAQ